ncbi:Cytochrome b-c1 complex subunit 7 [Dimargaris verticillata]|uniref:Cytochrome b-c1 complex subunit 7 n=1 Tax=Dimargaris verticillata TaxID=2761393 RepID=A0A9W8B6W9_9FUNG|nr:Cytochrome b-c1 complex subunit 7 [Dimargaris verticillata]
MSFRATHSLAHHPLARALLKPFANAYVRAAGYRKYGLRYDDLIQDDGNAVVQEAVRRLPAQEANARIFRLRQAQQVDLQHNVLPKDQWLKPEEDVRYLTPLIAEVAQEFAEREAFNTGEAVVKH